MTLSRRTLLKLAGLPPLTQIVGIDIAHGEERPFRHARCSTTSNTRPISSISIM
jgi:hypothetical protein